MKHDNTPYDDVFRTLLNDCTELIPCLLKELFGRPCTANEKVYFLPNEHFLNRQNGDTEKRITDTCFAMESDMDKLFHLECQINPDGSFLIRSFEYDAQIGLDNGTLDDEIMNIRLAYSAVIYLREQKSEKSPLFIRLISYDGELCYEVKVLRVQDYSIEEIFTKGLLFLIPFYIFRYERQFPFIEKDRFLQVNLIDTYRFISAKLEEATRQGIITEYTRCTLIDMTKKVMRNLTWKYENIRKRMVEFMVGPILEYRAKTLYNRGIQQGFQRGKEECLRELIHAGILKQDEAANYLGMTRDEFGKIFTEEK